MPDRHTWTAAMVLKWVLTHDAEAVLALEANYGGVMVDLETGTSTAVPLPTMRDVERAFIIDGWIGETTFAQEAVLRSELTIPARRQIYDALKQGRLEGRARRNGRGDVVIVESNQWLLLKIDSIEGHDLAIPVDVYQEPLPLPYSYGDYLAARVPLDAAPTVWPDPLFRADQAKELWPAATVNSAREVSEAASASSHGGMSDQVRETTADRNLRWYSDFQNRWQSRNYRTIEKIFDAISLDEFGHHGKTATIKKAVNVIRARRGETGSRFPNTAHSIR
jgi:hypothetical protein